LVEREGAPDLPAKLERGSHLLDGGWTASFGGSRVTFGAGSSRRVGEAARDLGGSRVLLVTDPGVSAAGHAQRAIAALAGQGVEGIVFDEVEENPTTRHVERGVDAARRGAIDLIVALGGGSVMDCAKGINFILTNGGRMEDYWGTNRASRPMLPSIGIPTTAGTGSEAQSYALIEQEGTLRKMACGDDKARFRQVMLDPDLTATLPRKVAALTAMDAVSHAVESYVTERRNPISSLLAREAWSLLSSHFTAALETPSAATARGGMLLGAYLAGAAVEASMLGAAHACANPLTSRYGIPHGAAVLLTLPHVIRFNELVASSLYDDLERAGAGGHGVKLPEIIEKMRTEAGLPERLREAGVPREDLPSLADEASQQWTAGFNPRKVERKDLLALYEMAY